MVSEAWRSRGKSLVRSPATTLCVRSNPKSPLNNPIASERSTVFSGRKLPESKAYGPFGSVAIIQLAASRDALPPFGRGFGRDSEGGRVMGESSSTSASRVSYQIVHSSRGGEQ